MFDGSLTTIRAHERNAAGRVQSDLSLPVSRTAAARHGAGLRRGRRDGRARRHVGIDDGAGGDPRDRRLWRKPGRAPVDGRCPRRCGSRRCATSAIRKTRSMAMRPRITDLSGHAGVGRSTSTSSAPSDRCSRSRYRPLAPARIREYRCCRRHRADTPARRDRSPQASDRAPRCAVVHRLTGIASSMCDRLRAAQIPRTSLPEPCQGSRSRRANLPCTGPCQRAGRWRASLQRKPAEGSSPQHGDHQRQHRPGLATTSDAPATE